MKREDVLKIQGAEVCPGNAGVIKLPLSEFRKVMEGLRNDPQSPMDFLREIVGMDWGEEGLGAVYFLESTKTGEYSDCRPRTACIAHSERLVENRSYQRARSIRLLRYPLRRTSRHAPPLLA